jgi:IS605 OrfB family transposase
VLTALTYNTEICFQSQEDFDKILEVLKSEQKVFNEASVIHYGKGEKRKNSIVDLHSKFYSNFRTQNPEIPSQIVVRGQQACLSAYRSIKSNKHKIDKPICKKYLSIRLDKRLYTWKDNKIKLTSLKGRIIVDFHRYPKLNELLTNYQFCDPLLFYKDEKIWIALTFKIETKPEIIEKLAVGIDLGVNRVVSTSEGVILKDKKFNKEKRSLRYLKRQLQSKGTKSARRHLKIIRRKEKNKNKNQTHLIANYILKSTKANVIVLEDLTGLKNPKGKKKRISKSNNNKIGQVPFAELRRILTYKAPIYRKTVIFVNPAFTSKMDYRTGKQDGLRRGGRYYCSDGVILDADINASINIAKRSKLPISLGSNTETYGQAAVTQPNVFKSLVL